MCFASGPAAVTWSRSRSVSRSGTPSYLTSGMRYAVWAPFARGALDVQAQTSLLADQRIGDQPLPPLSNNIERQLARWSHPFHRPGDVRRLTAATITPYRSLGNRATGWRGGPRRSHRGFRAPLVLDVLLKDFDSGAATRTNEIARGPQRALALSRALEVGIARNSTLRRRLQTPLRVLTSSERRTFGG
jgi:hypothetical protein